MSAPSPESARERAVEVIHALRSAGYSALVVGGAVRDRLLGREAQDVDVATSARPDQVQRVFRDVVPVGERFGVVMVVLGGGEVQVATFRRDARAGDGRRPAFVTFTEDPAEDARRRDFTVNGLFEDPDTGEILDFVGGRRDLEAGLIRAIGDPAERYEEDRLRMLRAVRFASVLGFRLEERTRRDLERRAAGIVTVSGERIREELAAILTGPRPGVGLRLLRETGLLAHVLPEVDAMAGVAQPPEFHPEGDVFEHTAEVLEHLERPSRVLAFAALLHDVGKPVTYREEERIRFDEHAPVGAAMARGICGRLRLSRAETEAVVELVRWHLRFMEVRRMREAKLRRFLLGDLAEEHLALHRADCLGSHGKLANHEYCVRKRSEWLAEPPAEAPLLNGRDLIGLGLEPGPAFAEILDEVEDRRMEGRLKTREEALEFVRRTCVTREGPDA